MNTPSPSNARSIVVANTGETDKHGGLPPRPAVSGASKHGNLPPLLLTAQQAANLCGVALRTWRSRDSGGLIPRPIRVGSRSTMWRYSELQQWVEAGCPPRAEWEAQQ